MEPIVWPGSRVTSSDPGFKVFIVHAAAEKSGWADKDWTVNFVLQYQAIKIYLFKKIKHTYY